MKDSTSCRGRNGKPLKSFETEEEALEQVIYVKATHGNEVKAYKCNICNEWHLAPKDRVTPSKKSECLDSKGKFKQLYPTEESAKRRAEILLEEQGKKLYVYRCLYCNGYHLTHKQRELKF